MPRPSPLRWPHPLHLLAALVLVSIPLGAQEKPANPRLTAASLEAQALKCRTAQEAFDLYTTSIPEMTEAERDKAMLRRRHWGFQAEENVVRVGKKWVDANEEAKLRHIANVHAVNASNLVGAKRYDEARADTDKALKVYPDHCHALMINGYMEFTRGDFKAAAKTFETCVQIEPKNFNTQNNAAVTAAMLGRHADAYQHFRQCAKINQKHGILTDNWTKFSSGVKTLDKKRLGTLAADIARLSESIRTPNEDQAAIAKRPYIIIYPLQVDIIPNPPRKILKPVP